MYCSVANSFMNAETPRKVRYVYDCSNISTVAKGDVVEVETKNGVELGVVFSIFEKDDHNYFNLYRTQVLKKVHGNTINARVRRNFEKYVAMELPRQKNRRKKTIKGVLKLFGKNYHYHFLKALCLGNHKSYTNTVDNNEYINVYFEGKRFVYLVSEDGNNLVMMNVILTPTLLWTTSKKAAEEFNKLYESYFGSRSSLINE